MAYSRKRRDYKPSDWNLYPWPDPPSGDPEDYGPTEMQEKLFIYHLEPWERPHFHPLDIVLMIGGAGGGKSVCMIAEVLELIASYPKCAAVIAGKNMPLLKRNVVDKFGERLMWTSPDGIEYPWEHPMVLKAPAEKTPFASFWNGATLRFLNIDDPAIVRGFTADLFGIEEVNLMEAASLKEMFRRSRGQALPIRQFILNMNPTGARDWVYDMFGLKQFRAGYTGPPLPIGEKCECEYCHICAGADLGKFEWVGGDKKVGPNGVFYEWTGGECPNPDCPTLVKKGIPQKKMNTCPGGQYYYRIIRSSSLDNQHLPPDFAQLQRGALSAEEYATYVKGEIVDLNTGYIYKDFTDENIIPTEFDPDEDIFWTMDFNFDPMCSQICQERKTGLHVVDEFTIWNADEMDVARAFVNKYKGFTKRVWLYGDPNGVIVASRADSNKVSFKVIYDYLKLHGFDVEVGMRKIKGETLIPIITRIGNLKASIKNAEGLRRIFVDPRCINLIESLKHSKWKEKSPSPKEDDSCDEVAKHNPRRSEGAVLMTHPQAALGYLVTKRFPVLMGKSGVRIMDTENSTVVATARKVTVEEKKPYIEVEEREDPFNPPPLSSLFGISNDGLKERQEWEKSQREEYEARLQEKLKKFQ